ncbi:MAG: methyltransferase [Euryarchaeota archaeon]|nr:methyltransferase [Euryarchaeota archaeon]
MTPPGAPGKQSRRATIDYYGIALEIHPEVYEPAEDTEAMLEALRVRPGQRVLDIGTGTGVLAIQAARAGGRVVATDVNPYAVALARLNAARNGVAIDVVRASLFQPFRGRFDVVLFNPPYLPVDPGDRIRGWLNLALDGGETGDAVIEPFLRDLAGHLEPHHGKAFMLVSSFTGGGIEQQEGNAQSRGFRVVEVASRRLPYERLAVLELLPRTEETVEFKIEEPAREAKEPLFFRPAFKMAEPRAGKEVDRDSKLV